MSEYTLYDRYYNVFVRETENLFVKKIKELFDDVKLKQTYDYIQNKLSYDSNNYEIVNIMENLKGIQMLGEKPYEELVLSCRECIEKDIISLFENTTEPIYTLKIVDRIWYKGLSVHFDKSERNIVLSYKSIDSLQYILLKDYKIIEDTFYQDEYKYILLILSFVFDFLYEFED